MIDHTTRMLAIDLQAAISTLDGKAIVPAMNKIVERLAGQPMPENWPSTIQLTYFVAVILQHIPAGVILTPKPIVDSGFTPMDGSAS